MEQPMYRRTGNWLVLLFALFSTPLAFGGDPVKIVTTAVSSLAGQDPVIFAFDCIDGEPGDTICIPVTVTNFNDIVIIQFELLWDSDVLDFVRIQNPASPSINVVSDFNQSGPNALKFIPLNFADPEVGLSFPDGTTLYEVCFRIVGIPGSESCVSISPYFDFEVADTTGIIPADSVDCCMMVMDAVNLVGFVHSCGPDMPGNNGQIDITVHGGTAPYNITWMEAGGATGGPISIPSEGGNTVLNVPTGNYTITITDNVGNVVTYDAKVDVIGLAVLTDLTDPTCYKFENGTIRIRPQGGTAPFSFIWESMTTPLFAGSGFIRNAGESSLVTSLPDGIYLITVEDSNGCKVTFQDTLTDKPFVFTVIDQEDATCNGSMDGFIDLLITGGMPDPDDGSYTITIRPGFVIQSDRVAIGLLNPGDYCITVQDEVSQCDTVFCFEIGYTDTIAATIALSNPDCHMGFNGSVQLHGLTNGVPGPAYDYFIYEGSTLITSQSGAGTFTYMGLWAGDFKAIIRQGACTSDTIYFTLTDPPPIDIQIAGITPDNCVPTNTGDIWFTITGATAPYTLDVGSGFQDADTIFNIGSGNYIVTVTDANNCMASLPFIMPDGDDLEEESISFEIIGDPCENGTVIVLYNGAPIPDNVGVLWSTGEVNDTITPNNPDQILNVDLFFAAPLFCLLNDTIHVDCSPTLELDITVTQPICGEGALGGPYTGTVIVDTLNAVPPVTWYWSFPDTTQSGVYSGLSPGIYYVTVTDGLDSTVVDSFEIIAPPAASLTFTNLEGTTCPDVCDGSVDVTGAGGDPMLEYILYWNDLNPMADTGVFFQIADLCPGLNYFTVSQDGICFYLDSVDIIAPDSVQIDLVESFDARCFGSADGSIEVIATGGTPGYQYDWLGGPLDPLITDIPAGTYHIIVLDDNGCEARDSFTISQPDTLIADIDASGTIELSCGSSNDGVITLDVSGGNAGDYTFNWSPDVSTIYQAVNLGVGTYHVTVSDINGCSDTVSYTLLAPPPIEVVWPIVTNPLCFGEETIIQITDVTGGSGNYQWSVNSGVTLELGDPLFVPAGIYILSVFDDNGCSDDTTIMIMEPNPIMIEVGPQDAVVDLGDSLLITGTIVQSDNPIMTTLWTSTQPMGCEDCMSTWVFNSLPAEYTWTVTDENGCSTSATLLVNVDFDRDIFIPNIFSPNFDGYNDDFKIFSGPGVVEIGYIRIFDRWGNILHEETGLLPSPTGAGKWDGTSNGEELNPGVYVFVVEISFIDGETLVYTGDITLVK